MTDIYETAINIPSIAENWPAGHVMPPLIADMGALLAPWRWGVIGHWRMWGEKFEEFWRHWGSDDARLDGQFGLFMEFAGGSKYAIWYRDDDAPGAHPVVYFPDDNRDISIVASNIKTFFSEWASGRGIGWLEPFDYEATPELLAERHGYGKQMMALINAMPEPPVGRPIADLQAQLDATCGRVFAIMDEKDRLRRLAEVYGDRIDLVSPLQHWPKSHPFPSLIASMGALIKPMINGSIGRCDFKGRILPDTLFDHGTDLHEQFGFFLVDHKYRWIAVWYHAGATPGSEPVVGFDEYSAAESAVVLAPNLHAFFADWANAVERGDTEYGLNAEPEGETLRPALARGLRSALGSQQELPKGAPIPDLGAFVRDHVSRERARDLADTGLQKMGEILRTRFPPADNAFDYSIFATVKGDAFEFSFGQGIVEDGFPESAVLTPLLFAAREARAKGPTASLGPWKSSTLSLKPDGRIGLVGYWNE